MSEASFASLNPALLARKGGAKPAMRPQLAPLPDDTSTIEADKLEDLGWNDMGQETDGTESAEVVSITGAAANEDAIGEVSPVIRRQQKDLSERVLADAAMDGPIIDDEDEVEAIVRKAKKSRTAKKSKPAKSAGKSGKRAAFTLRLDTQRHIKLRLASTMRGMSAQALVTEALDTMFADFEELDALAERMNRN